ncbi:hypothetical protein PL9631_370073 [Planktothrix paucivesiculata PCC 9631]|uniref:Uncharacterized protein n=1 Tax=Planktothrix paucivesiculata PCC 9631 TaxID=671071 RepID=A0A7Z9BQZ8_9CYAN|nr:hypothetical protein PL9631_370073 [Planktothrix paucivesiculata PCC 9631]
MIKIKRGSRSDATILTSACEFCHPEYRFNLRKDENPILGVKIEYAKRWGSL